MIIALLAITVCFPRYWQRFLVADMTNKGHIRSAAMAQFDILYMTSY